MAKGGVCRWWRLFFVCKRTNLVLPPRVRRKQGAFFFSHLIRRYILSYRDLQSRPDSFPFPPSIQLQNSACKKHPPCPTPPSSFPTNPVFPLTVRWFTVVGFSSKPAGLPCTVYDLLHALSGGGGTLGSLPITIQHWMFFPAPPPSSSSYSLSTRSVCLPGYLLSPKPCWSGLPPVVSTSTALFASASNLTTYLPPCLIHLFPHLPPTSNTCTRHPAFVMTGTGFLLEMQEKRDRRYNGHCFSKENITRKKTQER